MGATERRVLIGAVIGFVLMGGLCLGQEAVYDLIFAGGRVVDGTGAPWFRADVGVIGDRIASIGNLAKATARRRIDASQAEGDSTTANWPTPTPRLSSQRPWSSRAFLQQAPSMPSGPEQ